MNREIKFRVWIKPQEQYSGNYMKEVTEIDFINETVNCFDNQYDRCDPPNKCYEWARFEDVELMRFTGLKDSKGVEIYEGDIVRVSFEGKKSVASVGFREAQFVTIEGKTEIPLYISCNKDFDDTCKVIGNIHENPDLIKS